MLFHLHLCFFLEKNTNFQIIVLLKNYLVHIVNMYLYNLTLQKATGIVAAVHGNFSGTKQQEICVARGKILDLLRPDPGTGKISIVFSVEVFAVIRTIMAFRLTGGTKGIELVLHHLFRR